MEYAIQLLIPVVGGLMLGMWLTNTYHASPIWTVVLAILGMVAGIGIMYRRFSVPQDGTSALNMPLPPKKFDKAKPTHPDAPRAHVKDLDFLYKKYDDHGDFKELDDLDDDVSFDEPKPGQWTVPPKEKDDND